MNTLIGTLVGKLKKDPESKQVGNEQALVFDLPVKMGRDKETAWIEVMITGRRAETLRGRVREGTIVMVTGQIELRKWVNRDGATITKLGFAFPDVKLIDGYGSDGGAPAPAPQYGGNGGYGGPPAFPPKGDDVPW
jgi:single-strand DNA-binding protein